MGDNLGVCWSECVGYLPAQFGDRKFFLYEGWCYNINSTRVIDAEAGKSGKADRFGKSWRNRRDVDYDWDSIGADGTFMDLPLTNFQTCTQDSDCADAVRNCAVGCGNKEEVEIGDINS